MIIASKHLNTNLTNRFDKFVFWACIIDILFLPSVWFIAIPYTLPLIIYWSFKRNMYFLRSKEFKMFMYMFGIMCYSTIIGFILSPENIYVNSVYLLLFSSMFLYYFMFSNYINKYRFTVKPLLIAFIAFVVILAIIFNIDKLVYQSVKMVWNTRASESINNMTVDDFPKGYRFSFVYWDPNNIAYLINAVILYLWSNEKTGLFIKILSFLSLIFILVSCMSNGGFQTLIIITVLYLIFSIRDLLNGKVTLKIKPNTVIIFVLSLIILTYVAFKIPEYLQTNVAVESAERMDNNSAEPRYRIWGKLIEDTNFFEYILFGKGGVTLVNGSKYSPHNGHFFWILGYGFISYYILMYLFFRKRRITPLKKYIWIVPIFLGFSVNIMLGEIKLMGIFLLLVACSSSKLYLKNANKNNPLFRKRVIYYPKRREVILTKNGDN